MSTQTRRRFFPILVVSCCLGCSWENHEKIKLPSGNRQPTSSVSIAQTSNEESDKPSDIFGSYDSYLINEADRIQREAHLYYLLALYRKFSANGNRPKSLKDLSRLKGNITNEGWNREAFKILDGLQIPEINVVWNANPHLYENDPAPRVLAYQTVPADVRPCRDTDGYLVLTVNHPRKPHDYELWVSPDFHRKNVHMLEKEQFDMLRFVDGDPPCKQRLPMSFEWPDDRWQDSALRQP